MNSHARSAFPDKRHPRKVAILLLSDEKPRDLDHVWALCAEAKKKNVQIELFLMADSVKYLPDPRLQMAKEHGARVSFCALNAMERGMNLVDGYPWGFEESSQYKLACMMEESDVFIALC